MYLHIRESNIYHNAETKWLEDIEYTCSFFKSFSSFINKMLLSQEAAQLLSGCHKVPEWIERTQNTLSNLINFLYSTE